MAVQPIPDGYRSVTPYLIVDGADLLLRFIEQAFSGQERSRMQDEDGGVVHAEVQIGDSVVMLSDANERWPATPGVLHLYVEDCDTTFQKAVAAGGTVVQELATQFYGDRSGGVRDPLGNVWWITTHVEDVEPEEMERRAREWKERQGGEG
jgi:PhnB protein